MPTNTHILELKHASDLNAVPLGELGPPTSHPDAIMLACHDNIPSITSGLKSEVIGTGHLADVCVLKGLRDGLRDAR